jgi:2-hydroxychromene-2-carboxylate isomerase
LVITEQQEIRVSPDAIEFWFEFGSNYSYLSVMFWGNDRLDDVLAYCRAQGAR